MSLREIYDVDHMNKESDFDYAKNALEDYEKCFETLFNKLTRCGNSCVSPAGERVGLGIRIQGQTIIVTRDLGGDHVEYILQRNPSLPVRGDQEWLKLANQIFFDSQAKGDLENRGSQQRDAATKQIAKLFQKPSVAVSSSRTGRGTSHGEARIC